MIRTSCFTLLIAGALLAGATQAHADGIAVHVAGRTPAAVRHDVVRAAEKVCAAESARDRFGEVAGIDDCVDATVYATMAEIAAGSDRSFDVATAATPGWR